MSKSFTNRFNNMSSEQRSYSLQRLAQHLYDASQYDRLHGLMIEDWMQVHLENDGYYGGFLRDVQLAWDAAEKPGILRPKMIGRQVRYALLQTSVNSLASNMPPELLMAGVRVGRWSGEAALAYALLITHSMTKVTALTQVGTFLQGQNKEELAYKAFANALAGIQEIANTADRVKALVALTPHLPPNLLFDALGATREIRDTAERAKVLGVLAPHLLLDLIREAFEILWEFSDSGNRAIALGGLAPHLPQSLLSEALAMARQADGPGAAKILAALSPYLPPALIPEALEIAEAISNPYYRTAALMAFPQYRQSDERLDMMRQALLGARAAHDIKDRTEGIVLLAPYLPPELLPEAVTVARTIGDKEWYDTSYRAEALVALAPHLPPALQAEVIAEVRKWPLSSFNDCADVLAALAPHLSQDLMAAALTVAREIIQKAYTGDEKARDYYQRLVEDQVPAALVALVPYLPSHLMPEALAAASEIQVGNARSYALAALAPYLPQELLPKALQVARQIEELNMADYRDRALAALSQYGAPSALDEALTIAQQGQYADDSVLVLPILLVVGALLSPPEQCSAFLDEAVKAAREISNPRYRSEALTEVVEYLPSESRQAVLDEALAAAGEIQNPHDHSLALGRLIPYLPLEQRPRVVAQALKVTQMAFEKYARASDRTMAPAIVLSLLAPFLPPQQLQEAVEAARATSNLALRGRSLAIIAPHLPPDQCSMVLKEALEVARKIKDTNRFEELDQFPRSPLDLLNEQRRAAMIKTLETPDVRDRFEVLAQIALRLPSDQRQAVLVETLEAAEKVKDMTHDLEPTLAELAPYLSPDLCASALALARKMQSAYVLAALGPYVPPEERQEVVDEALAAALEIRAADRQAWVLALLLPQLQPDRRLEILKAALADMQQTRFPVNWKLHQQTLLSLASVWVQLPQQQVYALWEPTLHEYAKHQRTHFLAALSGLLPVIVAFDSPAALTETPGQSHLNLGTETRSPIRSVQLTIPESIDAFRKSIEKLDVIALKETIHAVLEICRQWSWFYSSPQRRD